MRDPTWRTLWLNVLIAVLTIMATAYMAQLFVGFASQFSDIIMYFVLAGLVAFVLGPLIERMDNQPLPSSALKLAERLFGIKVMQSLQRFRVPRLVVVGLLYVAMALILFGVIVVLIPPVIQQLQQVTDPDFVKRVSDVTPALLQVLADIGLRTSDVNTALSGALGPVQALATLALQNAFAILGGAVTLVGNLLLVLLLSFFFALDGPRLVQQALNLVPERQGDDVRMLADMVGHVFAGYVRATLLQGFLVGAGTAVVMELLGEPYLLVSSVFAGFFMLIPFVGTGLALMPPLLSTIAHDPTQAPVIFVVLLVYQLLVVNVLMPKLMSEALGLHPLIIMAALLVGVKIGGFWGALFGVPIAGVIATMAGFLYNRSVRTDVHGGEDPAAIKPSPVLG
jgi:predicted PurR-regulated permease PerM